jgi:heme exporter protein B
VIARIGAVVLSAAMLAVMLAVVVLSYLPPPAAWAWATLAALVVLGAFTLFFSLEFRGGVFPVLAVLALGTAGFTATATLLSGVSAGTTMGETILPILVFPLLVPVLIYGVTATAGLMAGLPVAEYGGHIRMLAAYDLIALVAGGALFRFIVED